VSSVLVTGGSGFIGSHVVDRLVAEGHDVRILDTRRSPYLNGDGVSTVVGDVRDVAAVRKAARGCDAIMHLAAAADVGEVAADPCSAEQLNARGTLAVLQAARDEGVKRVVYASTIWVYSDVEEPRVDEDTPLRAPAHLYSATKLAGELYCRSYASLYDVEYTILRFGIPYGPRCRPAAVVPAMVQRALGGEAITIAGAGDQSRRFVYVEDLADAVVRALAPVAANRIYNLVGGDDISIREVARTVQDVVGDTEIVHTEGRAGDFRGVEVSGERAAAELAWRATTPFREGVRRYVDWYREQMPATPSRPRVTFAELAHWMRGPSRVLIAFVLGLVAMLFADGATSSEFVHDLVGIAAVLALVFNTWSAAALKRSSEGVWLTSGFVFGWFIADIPDEVHGRAGHVGWLLLGVCALVAAHAIPRRSARLRVERESA